MPQIVADGDPCDLIVKSLFFNGKNGTLMVFMLQNGYESLDVDMDAQLTFNEGLVRIIPSGAIIQGLFVFSGNNFLNNSTRLALSLNKGQDVVDVVGHNVVLIVEWKFLLLGISWILIILSNH